MGNLIVPHRARCLVYTAPPDSFLIVCFFFSRRQTDMVVAVVLQPLGKGECEIARHAVLAFEPSEVPPTLTGFFAYLPDRREKDSALPETTSPRSLLRNGEKPNNLPAFLGHCRSGVASRCKTLALSAVLGIAPCFRRRRSRRAPKLPAVTSRVS